MKTKKSLEREQATKEQPLLQVPSIHNSASELGKPGLKMAKRPGLGQALVGKSAALHALPSLGVTRPQHDPEAARRRQASQSFASLEACLHAESARGIANINLSALTDVFRRPGGQRGRQHSRVRGLPAKKFISRSHLSESKIKTLQGDRAGCTIQ